jgi:hypothetical protein
MTSGSTRNTPLRTYLNTPQSKARTLTLSRHSSQEVVAILVELLADTRKQ